MAYALQTLVLAPRPERRDCANLEFVTYNLQVSVSSSVQEKDQTG
jgi:hypothetical protein